MPTAINAKDAAARAHDTGDRKILTCLHRLRLRSPAIARITIPCMNSMALWGKHILLVTELAGTAAFAMSGVVQAARKRLDPVGVFVAAFVSAFGGGTLRDLLLDQRPFFWVRHVDVLWAVFALCILAMSFMRARHFAMTERAMQWPDAIGLGLFAATGVHQALLVPVPGIVAVLMGVITGAFGGVLRDLICNEIPTAFKDHRPYALCAFAGGWAYVGTRHLDAPDWAALGTCVLVTAGLRMLSIWRDWRLPAWRV